MKKLTIKQLVDKYSDYLKSEYLSDKKYNKYLNQFKIDLIDKHLEDDFFIIDEKTINDIWNVLKNIKNDSMIIDKDNFYNFLNQKIDLEYISVQSK